MKMAIYGRDSGASTATAEPAEVQPSVTSAPPSSAGEKTAPRKIHRARKVKSKAEAIAEKIAAMQAQLREAQRSEREAQEAELLRLVRRADCLDEAIAWAGNKLA
jgi:hypothetical protein